MDYDLKAVQAFMAHGCYQSSAPVFNFSLVLPPNIL